MNVQPRFRIAVTRFGKVFALFGAVVFGNLRPRNAVHKRVKDRIDRHVRQKTERKSFLFGFQFGIFFGAHIVQHRQSGRAGIVAESAVHLCRKLGRRTVQKAVVRNRAHVHRRGLFGNALRPRILGTFQNVVSNNDMC